MNSKIETSSPGNLREIEHRHSRGKSGGSVFETCLTSPSEPHGSSIDKRDLKVRTLRCHKAFR